MKLSHKSFYRKLSHVVCLMFFVLNCTNSLFAQSSNLVEGKVVDAKTSEPLPGVSVVIKGTSKGVSTDFDGRYSLSATSSDVLVFSYIGFKTSEVTVGNRTRLDVKLEEDVASLEEVVVVGYGTQRKSDLTGSVAVVDVQDAKKTVTYDVAKMLQGQVPGVTVQSSGEPGGFVNIKIRGISSFNNNNPLFVVDGVIMDSPYDFAPGEIESMQVLKDASSAAIYGVRGANGVVIITTKKGKAGRVGVSYKTLTGMQNVPKTLPLTNREEYQRITNAAQINAGEAILPGNDPTSPYFISNVDTDWQKEAFRTGYVQNHNVSFHGGTEALAYNFNIDYFKNSSYINVPQEYERISTTINFTGKKNKFSYGGKLGYTKSGKENFNEYIAGTSSIINLLQAIPTMPVYDSNRKGGYGGTDNLTQKAIVLNIIGFNNLIDNHLERNRFIGNAWGEYEILKGLKYKFNASADKLKVNTRYFIPPSDLGWYYVTTNDEASLDVTSSDLTRTIIDNLATYGTELGRHKIDVLLGWIQERTDFYDHRSRGVGFADDAISHLEYANSTSTSEYENTVTGISYLSRLNYAFDDRYLLTLNFRRDKSSLFAKDNNTGDYFSVSGAWKIDNEKFIKLPSVISALKLRGGYGQLGNNTLGVYQYSSTVNSFASYPFGSKLGNGTIAISMKDPNVKWEDTQTFNIALELGLFDDKLQFTGEYYQKESTDLLAEVPIPLSTGAFPSRITTNAAQVRNTGLEFVLSYRNSIKDFQYEISANVGTLTNKVLKIGERNIPISGVNARTEVGRSIGELYAYETEGIFQDAAEIANHATQLGAAPGDIKFRDTNNDGIISDDDRTFQGVTIPKISYGLNFNASYKNFDFSMFWQGSAGHKVYNGTYHNLMLGQLVNHHTDMNNFWTPTNTNTNVPRPVIGDPNSNNRASDRFIEKGDFIKLQNIQIGYRLPLQDTSVFEKARIYVSGQNVITLTKYSGYDPDFISDGLFSRGHDYGSFPNPRTFAIGLEVDF